MCSCSNEAMDESDMEGYKPSEEYNEESRAPLFDISLTMSDSKKLWLIQWPYKQVGSPSLLFLNLWLFEFPVYYFGWKGYVMFASLIACDIYFFIFFPFNSGNFLS